MNGKMVAVAKVFNIHFIKKNLNYRNKLAME